MNDEYKIKAANFLRPKNSQMTWRCLFFSFRFFSDYKKIRRPDFDILAHFILNWSIWVMNIKFQASFFPCQSFEENLIWKCEIGRRKQTEREIINGFSSQTKKCRIVCQSLLSWKKPDSIFYEIIFYLQLRKILHLFISRTRFFFLTLDKSV